MAYGTIKVDTITFTDGGIDKSVSVSGLVQNPTFSGNITVTGTISGNTIQGQTISGVTVTGTTAVFTSGTFVSLTGATIQGTTATYATGTFTSLTGTTTSGTTANFVSGVFSTRISGATITGNAAAFTTVTGGTATITSGVFASGTAAAPSISFISDPNTGIYSPGADQVAVATNGVGRLFVDGANIRIPNGNFLSSSDNTGLLALYGGGVFNAGAGVVVYGASHATSADVIRFSRGAFSESMRIDSSGRVGVGTSSPSYLLQAAGTIASVNSFGNFAALQTAGGIGFRWTLNNDGTFRLQRTPDGFANAATPIAVDGSDRVGIGTTSPAQLLHLNSPSANATQWIAAGTGYTSNLSLLANGSGGGLLLSSATDSSASITNSLNAALTFGTNNTERARIDSSGRLLVGTSTSPTAGALTQYANFVARGNTGGAGFAGIITIGRGEAATSITSGEEIGYLTFSDLNGNEFATIHCAADANAGTNDYPGRLVFSTTADGASSPTERMRITSTGAVTVGGTSTDPVGASASQVLACGPGASQGAINYYNSSNVCLKIGRGDDGALVTFFRNQPAVTQVGNISVTTTATAYNTSSDYRLKENVTTVSDGITRLQQLKPSRFNFIADPDNTVDGFLAHEVQTVVPEAISGEKDAVDDDGNPVYQGIDQSKLVPLLTAALQEAIAKIEILEQRLDDAGIN